jgi:hypothetical protein
LPAGSPSFFNDNFNPNIKKSIFNRYHLKMRKKSNSTV